MSRIGESAILRPTSAKGSADKLFPVPGDQPYAFSAQVLAFVWVVWIADEADVVEYRDMLTIVRDRIQDAIKKGVTLQQVKAARLARDYEGRYGATQGAWTTDAFIEAAHPERAAGTAVNEVRP